MAASADLSVTKADAPDPVTAGTNLTYTIGVANTGPSDAQSVTLSDTLPAGTSFMSATTSQGTCSEAAGVLTCPLGSLAAGASATVTLVVRVGASVPAGTVISNTASAGSTTADPDTTDNAATATTTVATSADVSLTKTDSPDPVTAGSNITYTITVSNGGPSDAQGVTVTDPLPAGTTFVSATPTQGSCGVTTPVTCTLGTVANGASATVTLVVRVDPATAAGTLITNTATVSTTTPDDPANNSATATTTVATSADLSVTKTDSPDPVTAGNNITYTITITNNGPSDAQNVVFTDTPPANTGHAGFSVNSGPPAVCGLVPVGSPGAPSCTFPTFPAGATASITLVVQVDPAAPGGAYTNTANATSSTTADPNLNNNSGQATTTVIAASADLVVTKTDSPDPVTAGDNITYSITITNNGPNDAQNVQFTDTPPPNTGHAGFSVDSGPPGACTAVPEGSPGAPSCSFPTFPANTTATFTLVVTVDADAPPGTLTNTANATSSTTADPNPGNNTGTATTTVVPPSADLSVTKVDSPDPVTAGNNITYTITVTNNGPNDAENVTVSDSVPADTTLVPFDQDSGPSGTCSVGTVAVSCTYSSFPSGATAVFTMVVTVDPSAAPGTVISNTATVASGEVTTATADPDTANNSATATTTVASEEVPGEVPGEGPGETPGRPASPAPVGVGATTAATAIVATPRFTG